MYHGHFENSEELYRHLQTLLPKKCDTQIKVTRDNFQNDCHLVKGVTWNDRTDK